MKTVESSREAARESSSFQGGIPGDQHPIEAPRQFEHQSPDVGLDRVVETVLDLVDQQQPLTGIHCGDCDHVMVGMEDPSSCAKCGSSKSQCG